MEAIALAPRLPLLSADKTEHLAPTQDALPKQRWSECGTESVASSTTAEDTYKPSSDSTLSTPFCSDNFYVDGTDSSQAEQKESSEPAEMEMDVIGTEAGIRFHVRNTFIDSVSEPEQQAVVLRRSMSMPGLGVALRSHTLATTHNEETRLLLSAIARQRLSPMLFTSSECVWTSRGSIGHPQICNRPCEWVAKGHCRNGKDCNACHICAASGHKRSLVDKRDRKALSRMSYADRVRVFLPHLRSKAACWNFEANAECLLKGLKEAAAMDVWSGRIAHSNQFRASIDKGFEHCTFGEILRHSFLTEAHPQSQHVSVEELRSAYDAMRASL